MKVRFAQYGISYAHAAGKAAVLKANPDVEFCGVFEPDPGVRESRGRAEAYAGVRWYGAKEEMLEDASIAAIAVEGAVAQNLGFAREALERGKHVWLDKPAGDDWEAFQALIGWKGWQTVPVEVEPRYVGSLRALVADIRGEKQPDRSLDHELTVQETVLRAAGILTP